MKDQSKTKQVLIKELVSLRQRIAELEQSLSNHKRWEEVLIEEKERLDLALDGTGDGIWDWNLQSGEIIIDEHWQRVLGYQPHERIFDFNWWRESVDPESMPIFEKAYSDYCNALSPYYELEYRIRHKSGEWRWVWARGKCVARDTEGKPIRFIGTHRDISERKRIEEAMREDEARLAGIIDNTPAGYFYIDREGRFKRVNNSWLHMHGYDSPGEVIGQHFSLTQVKVDQEQAEKNVEFLFDGGSIQTGDFSRRCKDGSVRYHTFSAHPVVRGNKVEGLEGFIIDITDRKLAEEALKKSEEKFRALVENINDVFYELDGEGRLQYSSPSVERILGYNQSEVIGRSIADFLVPEDIISAVNNIQTVMFGSIAPREYRVRRKSGEIAWIRVSSSPVKKGDQVVGIRGILADITELKQAEEKIKASLLEKETMLKEIHHRVKNNLQMISSLLNMQSSYLQDEKTKEALNESMARVRTMAAIHSQLYQSNDLANVNFDQFIRDLVGNISQSYRKVSCPIEINADVDGDMHLSIEIAIPCGLIITELLSNALKHAFPTGKEGNVDIRIRSENQQMVLTIQDNGIGIPGSVDVKKVKSMGMELVHILVGQLSGNIDVKVGSGTLWTIMFPIKHYREWRNG